MELTEAELASLAMAESERGRSIRMVYFTIKRCPKCTEQRSCYEHMMEMARL